MNIKTLLLSALFLSLTIHAKAQLGTPFSAGGRGAAMGNASTVFTDINAAFANQAGLAFVDNLSFVAYGETRFLVTGINAFAFAAAYPLQKVGTLGLSIQHLGNSDYNEQKIGLTYARQLFSRLAIGAQINYLGARVAQYGAVHTGTFELGLTAKITDEFTLAFHTYSPIRIKLPTGDRLPAIFRLGAGYQFSDKVLLSAELEKNLDFPFNGKIGIEYRPLSALALRGGIQTSPFSACFGVGVDIKGFKLDIASTYHQVLGFTPCLSLVYALKKKS